MKSDVMVLKCQTAACTGEVYGRRVSTSQIRNDAVGLGWQIEQPRGVNNDNLIGWCPKCSSEEKETT